MTLIATEEIGKTTAHSTHPPPKERVRGAEEIVEKARLIGREVGGEFAADVDATARFPHEVITALRKARLLGVAVPTELGGLDASLTTLSAACEALSEHCAATGMIYAMHLIQIECMRRHGKGSAFFARYLEDVAKNQRLVASVTSEVGVGGDLRRSVAAVEATDGRFALKKNATTISYGAHADDLLVTARRSPEAAPGDQVLVLLRAGDYALERTGSWDTMGMRGTCSNGFTVTAAAPEEQILPEPFADIATQTMTPVSHCLWSSCWLGIAAGAEGRARAFVQQQARSAPGHTPPTALRLAELSAVSQTMRTLVRDHAQHCESLMRHPNGEQELSSLAFALTSNNLKIACSRMVVDVAHRALEICGIAGYKNDSAFGLGRHLRDALSAPLMIANDRIYATNASLLLVLKDDQKDARPGGRRENAP